MGDSNQDLNDDTYSEAETVERRMKAGLVKALRTPAKPHQPSKAKARESQSK